MRSYFIARYADARAGGPENEPRNARPGEKRNSGDESVCCNNKKKRCNKHQLDGKKKKKSPIPSPSVLLRLPGRAPVIRQRPVLLFARVKTEALSPR